MLQTLSLVDSKGGSSMLYQVTHDDLDGVGCALALAWGMDDRRVERKVFYCSPQEAVVVIRSLLPFQEFTHEGPVAWQEGKMTEDDRLVITDISLSYKDEDVWSLLERAHMMVTGSMMLVDHHASSAAPCEAHRSWCKHRTDKCAALLVADEYDFPRRGWPKQQDFCLAVDAWDTWKLNSIHRKRGEGLNQLLRFMGHETFFNEFLINPAFDQDPWAQKVLDVLSKKVYPKTILSPQDIRTDKKGKRFTLLVGLGGPSVAHELLASYPLLDYVMVMNLHHQEGFSLYSRDGGWDVSQEAVRRGGGGHRAASGFPWTGLKASLADKALNDLGWVP